MDLILTDPPEVIGTSWNDDGVARPIYLVSCPCCAERYFSPRRRWLRPCARCTIRGRVLLTTLEDEP